MRITFVLPELNWAGGIRAALTHARNLKERGHRVVVVAPRPRPRPLRAKLMSMLRGGGWPARRGTSPYLDGIDKNIHILKNRRPVADADVPNADVVIATWWETAAWVAALDPVKGSKVHFMMDYEIWGGQQDRVDATCRLPMPKIIIARWVGDLLRDRFGIEDTTLVPCGVDLDRFHAPPRGKQPLPTVGLTYTTMPNKGCDISLRAFELARREIPNLRLVAFGSKQRPSVTLPLPDGCEFGFRVSDHRLRDFYARCDAWLFGTRIEGFGLPILEAMACRTPVIGTPAGAAPELLASGGGILVRPEDPEDMAAAIVRLCNLPDPAWRALSDAAYATAARYTWDDATDRFEQALMTAIEKNDRDRSAKDASLHSLG